MKFRSIKALCLAALVVVSPAWAETGKPAAGHEAANNTAQPVPKFFIWGLLISAIQSEVFSVFTKWLFHQIGDSMALSIPVPKDAPPPHLVHAGSAPEGSPAPIVDGSPTTPIKVHGSESNYQGVHFAIAILNPQTRTLDLRPVDQGYRSGERFKLRVVSTFTGDMKVENINPRGERRQIYPADSGMRIRIEAGKETLIPAGPNEYFEFTKTIGEEKLVLTLRDPRATPGTMSHHKVYRQNETYGSNFVQEVASGKYPVISESISLVHL